MARIRNGKQAVLLVIDVQNGAVASACERASVLANIKTALDKARQHHIPVIWVQHNDEDLPRGSEQWQIVKELDPQDSEPLVEKKYNSAFEDTKLGAILEELGATELIITGAATNWCIRASIYAALERGYDVTLVGDAHTTESIQFKNGRTIEAKDLIDELNIAVSRLSYAGIVNRTVKAAELEF